MGRALSNTSISYISWQSYRHWLDVILSILSVCAEAICLHPCWNDRQATSAPAACDLVTGRSWGFPLRKREQVWKELWWANKLKRRSGNSTSGKVFILFLFIFLKKKVKKNFNTVYPAGCFQGVLSSLQVHQKLNIHNCKGALWLK